MTKEMNYEALQANLRLIDKKGEQAFETARAAGALTPEQEKFSALISDEAFVQELFAADSAEEAKELFAKNGLDLSVDEINAFGASVAAVSRKLIENGGELSEDELEQIAGGASFTESFGFTQGEDEVGNVVGAVTGVGGIAAGVLGGTKLGAAIGTAICPGLGTAIGVGVGGLLGVAAGLVGGASAGYFGTVGIIKGAKKLGRWFKSWF